MNHGFGLEKPGLAAVRHPTAALVILAVLLLGSLSMLPQLRFDEDINRVFLSQNESSQNYRNFLTDTGGMRSDVALFIEADQPFSADDYSRMRDLALDLELLDRVSSVLSPFAIRFPKTNPDHAGETVIPAEIDVGEIERRLEAFQAAETFLPPLISGKRTSALFIVSGEAGLSNSAVREILGQIKETSASILGDRLRFTVTGEDAISIAIVDGLKTDLVKLNVLGFLLVAMLALALFRSVSTALVAVVPALFGVLISLSIFALLDYPITVISNVLPILVLVLGIADSMHLVLHLRHQPEGEPVQACLERTIRDIGPACVLTALTTAIAFLAIAISDNDQLFEFAVVGALSVLISSMVVITSFALLGKFVARSAPQPEKRDEGWALLTSVSRAVLTQDRKVIALAFVLFAVGVLGYSQTRAWFPYEDTLPRYSALISANERLFAEFGGIYRLWSELDTDADNSLSTETGWNRLVSVTKAIEQAAPGYTTVSMASIARWLGEPGRLPTTDELAVLPETLRDQLLSKSGDVARVVTFVPEPMRDLESRDIHDRIESAALNAAADRVVGLPNIMRHESIAIIEQLGLGLLLACLSSTLLIALAFRWPALVAALVVPNVLPLILTTAALHVLTGGQLTPTAVLALTIAFGIAIDDSIHFVNRFHLERNLGKSTDEALRNAIQETGRVMVLTTMLLSVGLLITMISEFHPVQLFGQMLILTFFIALLADLLLLPAVLKQKWMVK